MSDDVKAETIRETQDILGKFIKKPILTEKLLKKPPFRFLHDICTAAMRETGFFSRILNEPEDMIENIKDRNGKIAFLQKVINAVESANGIKLAIKPSKVVAGLEATKTNEFLQALGKALNKQQEENKKNQVKEQTLKAKISKNHLKDANEEIAGKKHSTHKALKLITENETGNNLGDDKNKKPLEKYQEISPKGKQITKLTPRETSKKSKKLDKEKKILDKKHKEKPLDVDSPATIKKENKEMREGSTPPKQPDTKESDNNFKVEEITINSSPGKENQNAEVLNKGLPNEEITEKPTQHRRLSVCDPTELGNEGEIKVERNSAKEEKEPIKKDTPESGPNIEKQIDNRCRINTLTPFENALAEKNKASSRSSSPASSDRLKYSKREGTIISRPRTGIRQATARPASARPAAPRIRERNDIVVEDEPTKLGSGKGSVVNVIVDKDIESEPDDNFISLETTHDTLLHEISNSPIPVSVVQGAEHGHLVEQILEVQKELENENLLPLPEDKVTGKTGIEWDTSNNSKNAIWEIEKLRGNIQVLTRSVNPLGNLLNFFQEDVDSIQKEFETWKNKNSSLCIQIANEKSITEQFIEPLKIHLKEIQQSIDEQYEQISIVKANIIRNNKKIQKLLAYG